jgi:predicted ATP-grasp superfamily ATP-dependent carboligase
MPAEIDASRDRPRAIVLGIEHPRGVAAIQSLGRDGVPVIGVDHDPTALGFFSRHLKAKFLIEKNAEKTLAFLEEMGRDGGGMLMPTNDDYLILVSKNHERLSRHFVLTTPPWDSLAPLMDVARCFQMAREVGIRTPNFFKPESEADMRNVVANLDLARHEYMMKTMPGTAPADARTGRFTRVAPEDRESIERECLSIFARAGEFPTIMQVVPGAADRCIGVCMAVGPDHESAVTYSVRRLRLHTYSKGGRFVHPYEMGANVFCESIHDEEASEAAKRLVRRAGYYGPMAVEFRRDPTDESLVLIKADPRYVRATGLSTAIGLDLPRAVHGAFSGRPAVPAPSYPDGVAWIWLTSYLETLWNKRSDRSLRRELFALWKNLRRIKAVAYLDRSDLGPFLVSLRRCGRDWMRYRMTGLRRRFGNGKPVLGPHEGERAPG